MVQLLQQSIAQEAMDINLAKVGYTAYYVDGANGLDTYPGDSWEQPFKTIQHAVDTAESWCTIYIRSMAFSDVVGIANAGQPDVTVDSSVGFSVGDVVIVRDDNTTERATIASIVGDVLTMASNLDNACAAGSNGIVIRVYDETVTLMGGTTLIGENSRTTIVSPATLYAIYSGDRVDSCEIRTIGAVCDDAHYSAIYLHGEYNNVIDCIVDGAGPANVEGCTICGYGHNRIIGLKNATPVLSHGIIVSSRNNEVQDCEIYGVGIGMQLVSCNKSVIHDNTITFCTTGLTIDNVGTKNNTILHNNFLLNTAQIDGTTPGVDNHFIENHFDNHTTDTDNDGLADTVYTENSITDYQPVSRRNGWKQISLASMGGSPATAANQELIIDAVNAVFTLSETGGTLATDGTEQNMYINNAPAGVFDPKMVQIDFTNHTAGETVVIREYYRIKSGGGLIKKDERQFAGVQDPLLKDVTFEPNRFGVKVTIEKTVGTNRDYDFEVVYNT